MMKRRTFLAASVVSASACAAGDAPRFKARSIDGRTFDNASLKGKVVLVQMWATWCGYCRRDQSAVDEMVDEFEKDGLVVLAVNVGETRKKVQQYLAENPRKGHMVLTGDTNLAAMFGGNGFPHYALINREGRLVDEQSGAGGAPALYRLLASAGLESRG